jgi:hypothetical protein
MPDTPQSIHIGLQEASTRNEYARRIIAGFRSAMPTLTDIWQYLEDALNDTLVLATEITRLADELERTRIQRANLLAAMRATLAAQAEGEPDPLWYLRDELDALSDAPETFPDASRRRA